jgi:hypothetical protein
MKFKGKKDSKYNQKCDYIPNIIAVKGPLEKFKGNQVFVTIRFRRFTFVVYM